VTFNPIDLDESPKVVDNWEKPSMAVLVSNGNYGAVVFHAGPHIHQEIDNVGSHSCEDLGLEDRAGIWIWQGTYIKAERGWDDPILVGIYRVPDAREWVAIKKGENPWNEEDWLMEETVQ
jgi:hypothetical protein